MLSMQGIAQESATFFIASSIAPGRPCKMITKMTVSNCNDGDDFFGVSVKTEGSLCSVIFHGFVTMPYTGTVPAVGYTGLAANGAGGVKASTTAIKRLVVATDTDNKTVTLLL